MDINLELTKCLLRGHDAELFGGFQTAFISQSAVSQAVKTLKKSWAILCLCAAPNGSS